MDEFDDICPGSEDIDRVEQQASIGEGCNDVVHLEGLHGCSHHLNFKVVLASDGNSEDCFVEEGSCWDGDIGVEGEGLGDHIDVGCIFQDQLEAIGGSCGQPSEGEVDPDHIPQVSISEVEDGIS